MSGGETAWGDEVTGCTWGIGVNVGGRYVRGQLAGCW